VLILQTAFSIRKPLTITFHVQEFGKNCHEYISAPSSSTESNYEYYTGRFIMFSIITNIYNKKTKGPTLMELFTATGKLN
jgi:hypothetical protein